MDNRFLLLLLCGLVCGIQAGCTPDDSFEPNDMLSMAKIMEFGNHSNLMVCGGSMDNFLFVLNVSAGEYLVVDISVTTEPGRFLDMSALLPQGDVLAGASSAQGETRLRFVATADSPVFILQLEYGQSVDLVPVAYGLSMFTSSITPCVADMYEPNNVSPGFTLPSVGRYSNLTLCKYDLQPSGVTAEGDFFNLAVPADSFVRVTVTRSNPNVRLAVSLADVSGKFVKSEGIQGEYNRDVFVVAANAGPVATNMILEVKVAENSLDWETDYSMEWEVVGFCVRDAAEPNNNPQEATPLAIGQYLGDLTLCGAEQEFFAVTVAQGGANIQLHFPTEIATYKIVVADSTFQKPILTQNLYFDNGWVYFYAETAGTYLVQISAVESLDYSYGPAGNYSFGIAVCQSSGTCFQRSEAPGCSDSTTQSCVCDHEPLCCSPDGAWDATCETYAGNSCNLGCADLIPGFNYNGTLNPNRTRVTLPVGEQTSQPAGGANTDSPLPSGSPVPPVVESSAAALPAGSTRNNIPAATTRQQPASSSTRNNNGNSKQPVVTSSPTDVVQHSHVEEQHDVHSGPFGEYETLAIVGIVVGVVLLSLTVAVIVIAALLVKMKRKKAKREEVTVVDYHPYGVQSQRERQGSVELLGRAL